ncbi:hypothetical protein BLJ79_13980 [Arthrobacter sp. UCD-GKA]|uniref:hypothetical protein n=1 Tax=Arthrobacter sp. UCD-GKA TaxID=1913576 RepID=UPI0008DE924F|nr:hypothetical protein [Arthrobacter sp. UCD-GKA]OIH83808.1 hypothetical protein BLJ79_13980 [Arthrobacter sp. UCD-GKA]
MKKQGKIITGVVSSAAVVGLVAWGIGFAGAASSNEWKLPGDLVAGPAIAEANPSTGTAVKTDRFDNVQKKIGEKAGLIDEQTNKSYFTIEVTKTQLLSRCTSRVGNQQLAPTRSRFLVLDVKATLAASVSEQVGGSTQDLFMPLVAEAFSVTTSSGTPDRNVTSETAWGCFDDSVLLPPVVNPGQSVTGKVVLDVDATKGKVAYDPEDNGGWSWPYGG